MKGTTMLLDPTTNIGKMRLRVGDYSDLPLMPDVVYDSALTDCDGYLPRACVLMAQYILASLTGQTHQKLAQIEVYGDQWFTNYLAFVKATILNPNLMNTAPLPYTPAIKDAWGNVVEMPLIQFQKDWNNNYSGGLASQQMRWTAYPGYPGYDGTDNTTYLF
jgi:hypothetical protein